MESINAVNSLRKKIVINFLEEFKVLLILDGFDELAQNNYREDVIREIGYLTTRLDKATVIVTSRTGDFKYKIDNSDIYELSPLNKQQISAFAHKWLKDKNMASDFLTKVYDTPFADTAIRPLTIAHLCAIYERIHDIPEKPKTVYKKIVTLLLEEWDQQRFVKRESRYAHFEVDRKYEFLCHLSYVITKTLQKTVFTTNDLQDVYYKIYEEYSGLTARDSKQVVSEIETHNGLLVQSGFEEYEFAHKSLQEFLSAEYIVKLPSIPTNWKILANLPNELAIAVAVSSSPSRYFYELVLNIFNEKDLTDAFVRTFIGRLLIEKPDFKFSVWLDLAFLVLGTKYIENGARKNQVKHLSSDTILNDFEKLTQSLHSRSTEAILNCYETKNIFELENEDNIHELNLIRRLSGLNVESLADYFPQTLYVKNSFLRKWNMR